MNTPIETKERRDMDPAYTWDLSTLYHSDDEWKEDLEKLGELTDRAAAFSGKLTDAATIRAFMDAETAMEQKIADLYTYAMLRLSEDTRDAKAQEMMSIAESRYTAAVSRVSFASPEILSLPEETLREVTGAEETKPYHFNLEKLLERKPHVLSSAEEKLLASFGEVLNAPERIAENLQDADMTFEDAADSKGEMHEVTQANYILLQQSPDRTLRENAFRSFYKGFRGHINTFTAAYAGCVKGAAAEAAARHYESSRAMSMADEHIPTEVYDNLTESVRKFMPAMYRYVKLRKRILGLDELHYYDVYTPLSKGSTKTWTYAEACDTILEALKPLGSDYTDRVKKAFADRWIDVYPNKGKRGGAFSSGTYRSNPFILTSFTGNYDSVTTVAHEMGHSMHTWLSNHTQPAQYADYTLFVAEVASTVNENLLVEHLLGKTTDPAERLALLNQYLEGFKGTVYRQTMFAEFERAAHEMAERGEGITAESLNRVYKKLVEDYFGPELVMDDEVQYEWARIPHFYRPFYVYKYATSYSAAIAISEAIMTSGEAASKPYLEFLSMGGSKYPLDELAHGGVDLRTAAPIESALRKFERILDEAEKAAAELGL